MSTELPFRYFDCDNHYYEALDAFTRYLEPEYRKRAMQWAQVDGKQRLLVGGRINKFIPNPTFDPVAAPGALDEYFRGRNPQGTDPKTLFGALEPIRPEYRDRDARLAVMDRQGMAAAIFLPTLGVGMEQALAGDRPALLAAFRAFNRWLAEDWGFAYRDRIFAAPYITLADPDNATRELAWALEHDARFVVMVSGPVTTAAGSRAPADPMFDEFWRLANDSGITVLYHGGETLYTKYLRDWGENDFTEAFRANTFRSLVSANPIHDTLASHLALGLFHRFPNLRIATIETGSEWVIHLFDKLTKSYGQVPQLYPEDPRETFKRHVWVSPYYEEELGALLNLLGADHILMGSDYPHVEGLAEPATYLKDLQNFDYTPAQCETVMKDNGWFLATRRPA
ncbi:amidohydrolase family protein [Nocardia sp. BMG111209]|uniref:amidohydrolase family protein n=1 Tax=Nocardia sp. BMG111209 TaxID=1160137 RepID=UPI00035FD2AC|nr:amidohydrolase family protein [Nocardia sp. BMG111209]